MKNDPRSYIKHLKESLPLTLSARFALGLYDAMHLREKIEPARNLTFSTKSKQQFKSTRCFKINRLTGE